MLKSRFFRLLLPVLMLAGIAGQASAQSVIRARLQTRDVPEGIDSIVFESMGGIPAIFRTPNWGGSTNENESLDFTVTRWPDRSTLIYPKVAGSPIRPWGLRNLVPDSWYIMPTTFDPPLPNPARIMFSLLSGIEEPGSGTLTPPAFAGIAPNPFSLRTEVAFSNPKGQPVELAVFDRTGARVKTLAQGNLAAGSYRFAWDGTGLNGRRLEDGVYFCRLSSPGAEFIRKLVFVR